MGGGTPPALSDLNTDLMMAEPGRGGLFDKGAGDVGLLTNSDLLPKLTVTKLQMSSEQGSITMQEIDFTQLRDRAKPLDVVSVQGGNSSYNVEAGDTPDAVILHDRRTAAREALKQ